MEVLEFKKSHTEKQEESTSVKTEGGVSIASFVGFDEDNRFLVSCDSGSKIQPALSVISLSDADCGESVVVAFQHGDADSPVIIGRLQDGKTCRSEQTFKVDNERVVLRADRDIELCCGEASIVLTRAGKVLIKGSYVLTKSTGANKIKGAYVDIN